MALISNVIPVAVGLYGSRKEKPKPSQAGNEAADESQDNPVGSIEWKLMRRIEWKWRSQPRKNKDLFICSGLFHLV